MNFLMNEVQTMAVDNLRKFCRSELQDRINAFGDNIPREELLSMYKSLIDFGLVVSPIAEEHGGMGLDWKTHLMLYEEVSHTSLDLAVPVLINAVCADLLIRNGSSAMIEQYLPGLLSGEVHASLGISEPDVGSDVAAVKTRAVRDGDHWVINGEKTWISNGEFADFHIATCRTGENELTHILIDRKEHGFISRPIPKIALNSQSTAQIILEDVRVPITNTVGKEGTALKNTLVSFERARCHMAMWGIGVAHRAMDEAIKYSQERTQHGKPIAGHQLIAEKIADMATHIDAARLLTLRACDLIDHGQRADKEAAMAKWYGTEIAVKITRDALQIHGGNGVTKEFIVERLAREALICPIPDGTTEIQKLLIARSLTGVQAFR